MAYDESIEDVVEPAYFLTTIDNPFHPYHEYDQWLRYDHDHGYNTQEYIARVAPTSEYNTEAQNQRILNAAIDDACRLDLLGIYKRVVVLE